MTDSHFFWSHVVDHVWKLNLQAALLAAIATIVCFLGRKRLAPGWRALLWMLVFVRLVVPFGPTSMFSLGHIVNSSVAYRASASEIIDTPHVDQAPQTIRADRLIEGDVQSTVSELEPAPVRTTSTATISADAWSLRDVCVAVWLIGAVFLLARLGCLRLQLSRELLRLDVVRQREMIQLAESVAAEARLKNIPRMLWGSTEASPAVCGWLFPCLILPKDSPILAPSRLRAVLLHEFRHIRTADTLLTWPLRVLCAACWFNPLLWYASRKWHEERELCCDEWVLRQIGLDQRRSYLETLVEVVARSSQAAPLELTVNIVSTVTMLERRIIAMKRYRPSTWTGWMAGSLLAVLVGILGLTDVAAATKEPASGSASTQAAPAKADDGQQPANQPAADQTSTKQEAAKPTLKPKIIFAKHVILWEGTEVLTEEQLKERLAKLRQAHTVKTFIYQSQGYSFTGFDQANSEQENNKRLNDQGRAILELVAEDQRYLFGFLPRRGSGAVDRIKTQADLKIDSTRSLKGRVVMPPLELLGGKGSGQSVNFIGGVPAKGAQVVILPLGEPGDITLRDGKLRDPQDEIWYETNAEGKFEADPSSLPFDPIHLFGDGKYLTLVLHETGYRIINGQLAASDAIYELIPWTTVTMDTRNLKENEQLEIRARADGVPEQFPGLIMGWVGRGHSQATVKLPRGKCSAVYQRKTDDQWNDANFRHSFDVTADSPKEITLPATP